VHAPSSDAELSGFNDCIHDLEEEINKVDSSTTAVVIAGDFNAHLETLAGHRGSGTPSLRGFVLKAKSVYAKGVDERISHDH
jgi:hypothetical protein